MKFLVSFFISVWRYIFTDERFEEGVTEYFKMSGEQCFEHSWLYSSPVGGQPTLNCNFSQILTKAKSTLTLILCLFCLPCEKVYTCLLRSQSGHITGFQHQLQCRGGTANNGCPIISLWGGCHCPGSATVATAFSSTLKPVLEHYHDWTGGASE